MKNALLILSLAASMQFAFPNAYCQPGSNTTNPGNLDRQLVLAPAHTDLTDSVYAAVMRGLALLPASTKQFFLDRGVRVMIVPQNADDKSEYQLAEKRVIIKERNNDGTAVDLRRLHITTLHELGHAYDQQLGYPSGNPEFRSAYNKEAPAVRPEYRALLAHFLQPGNRGPRECFASLFACRYYVGDDKRLTELKESFPETFAYAKTVHE